MYVFGVGYFKAKKCVFYTLKERQKKIVIYWHGRKDNNSITHTWHLTLNSFLNRYINIIMGHRYCANPIAVWYKTITRKIGCKEAVGESSHSTRTNIEQNGRKDKLKNTYKSSNLSHTQTNPMVEPHTVP